MLILVLLTKTPIKNLVTNTLNKHHNPSYKLLFTIKSGSFNDISKETFSYLISGIKPCLGTWSSGFGFLQGSGSVNHFLKDVPIT